MSFGEKLRVLLAERDMTQKELARQLNIAPSTMGSYIQNVREPDFATIKTIARFFGVTVDYLLSYCTEETQTPQEQELLRIFRSLSPAQKEICIEQCRVFVRANHKKQNIPVRAP